MSHTNKLSLLALAAAFVSTTFISGCVVHAGYYDPYYYDHHQWVIEEPYYSRWETDTHKRHEDFKHRQKEEQREYWEWRHHQH